MKNKASNFWQNLPDILVDLRSKSVHAQYAAYRAVSDMAVKADMFEASQSNGRPQTKKRRGRPPGSGKSK